jgi:hypothetical protein
VTRLDATLAMRHAAFRGDRAAWLRTYRDNSVSQTVAQHCWTAGRRLRRVVDECERNERRVSC